MSVIDVCLSVCMSSSFFSDQYVLLLQFFPIPMKLGTHDLCANVHETGPDFQNFDLKIVRWFFLEFKFGLMPPCF